jgi:hypothetical protein
MQTFRYKANWKQLLEHQKQGSMSTSMGMEIKYETEYKQKRDVVG